MEFETSNNTTSLVHKKNIDSTTESELVKLAAGGDQVAFGRLYDRYAGLVRAQCYDRTGNLDDAQELCQEVFLRAYSKLDGLRDPAKFSSWLIGITTRVCQELIRLHAREHSPKSHGDVEAVATLADDSTELALGRAIAQLSDRQRLALHAFYLQGQDAEQARRALALSKSGFYKLLRQAREELIRIIEKGE